VVKDEVKVWKRGGGSSNDWSNGRPLGRCLTPSQTKYSFLIQGGREHIPSLVIGRVHKSVEGSFFYNWS
jgi:hypothetical protein